MITFESVDMIFFIIPEAVITIITKLFSTYFQDPWTCPRGEPGWGVHWQRLWILDIIIIIIIRSSLHFQRLWMINIITITIRSSWHFQRLWKISIVITKGGICPCRHCRRQCKSFASSVNFSICTHFFVFLSPKLLKLAESDGVKVLAWNSGGVKFWTNSMSDHHHHHMITTPPEVTRCILWWSRYFYEKVTSPLASQSSLPS